MFEDEKNTLSDNVMDYSFMGKTEPRPGLRGAIPIVLCKIRSVFLCVIEQPIR